MSYEREQRVYEEVLALWRELYGGPPPASADSIAGMLDVITSGACAPDYQRLYSPHTGRTALTYPRATDGPASRRIDG